MKVKRFIGPSVVKIWSSPGPAHGTASPRRQSLAAQVFRPAHHQFHPRAPLCPQFAARPAAPHPGQPGMGERPHLPAAGQRDLGLLMRLSGRVHQARGGQAGARRHELSLGYQCLAAGAAGPTARPGPRRSFRPGWAIRGQYVGNTWATPTKRCFATPKPSTRTANAASATTMPKPEACGPGSKPRSSKPATGLFSLT